MSTVEVLVKHYNGALLSNNNYKCEIVKLDTYAESLDSAITNKAYLDDILQHYK